MSKLVLSFLVVCFTISSSFAKAVADIQVASVEGKSKLVFVGSEVSEDKQEDEEKYDQTDRTQPTKKAVAIADDNKIELAKKGGPSEIVILGATAEALFQRYFVNKTGAIVRVPSLRVGGKLLGLAMNIGKGAGLTCTKPEVDFSPYLNEKQNNESDRGQSETDVGTFVKLVSEDPELKDYLSTRCAIKIDSAGNVISN